MNGETGQESGLAFRAFFQQELGTMQKRQLWQGSRSWPSAIRVGTALGLPDVQVRALPDPPLPIPLHHRERRWSSEDGAGQWAPAPCRLLGTLRQPCYLTLLGVRR